MVVNGLIRFLNEQFLANPPRARRRAAPRLERLEDRDVPSVFTNQVFVATLYEGLLNRAADAGGLNYWTGQMNSGVTPVEVASGLLASTEYRGRAVGQSYQALLGRTADLGGLNTWIGSLQSGASLDQIKAGILGSDEFFTRSGGTAQGFLTALYQDVLGRPLDPVGQSTWSAAAATSAGRLQIAQQVVGSSEAQQAELSHDYQEILGRPLDPVGLSYWGGALRGGAPHEAVLSELFGSSDFLTRLQNATSTGTDPLQSALQFISANHLFQVPGANTTTASQTAFDQVQSPAFGAVRLPAGFDPFSTPAVPGLFSFTGFLTGSQLLGLSSSSASATTTNTGSSLAGLSGTFASNGFAFGPAGIINTGFNNFIATAAATSGGIPAPALQNGIINPGSFQIGAPGTGTIAFGPGTNNGFLNAGSGSATF
jgi:hypothetical protein